MVERRSRKDAHEAVKLENVPDIGNEAAQKRKKSPSKSPVKKRKTASKSPVKSSRVTRSQNKVEPELSKTVIDEAPISMKELMGFDSFKTTKGQHVFASNVYAVYKPKVDTFRQYMNRSKGFNRPLSPPPTTRKSKGKN